MADIQVDITHASELTVFTLVGELKAGELLESFRTYSEGEVTRLILVDFTEASWTGVSASELRRDAATGSAYSYIGGRSAFVFSTDADFGIGRMFQAFASMENYQSLIRIFRSIEEAKQWLVSEVEIA